MQKDNLKLIAGITISILFFAGFYYMAIYRNSSNNTVKTDISNTDNVLPKPSSGSSGSGGSGGLPKLK